MQFKVESYRSELYSNNMHRVVLNFKGTNNYYKEAVIYFVEDALLIPGEKVKVLNGSVTYSLPFARYSDTIDLLRNEKPIFFSASPILEGTLQNGILDEAMISTHEREPVGEEES